MKVQKTAIIILGASGDLARKKLFPSLLFLLRRDYLDRETCAVIGNGRKDLTTERFREICQTDPAENGCFTYHQGMAGLWEHVCKQGDFERFVIFFSLPPDVYIDRCKELITEGFPVEKIRLVIEKPFGYNTETAEELDRDLQSLFSTEQIYLIDHYLGKETFQNLIAVRFSNRLMGAVWNREHIRAIEINGFETIGIDQRGETYDKIGAIRDVIQNHLLQLAAVTLMEKPDSLKAGDIQKSRYQLLREIRCVRFRRFQYEGYLEAEGVASDSNTETYAELEMAVENSRWQGVPIYIRGGKRLPRSGVEVILYLRRPDFPPQAQDGEQIRISIQPEPSLEIWQQAKIPGLRTEQELSLESFKLGYQSEYAEIYREKGVDAYTQIFYSVLQADKSLFVSAEEAIASWKAVEPALDADIPISYRPDTIPGEGNFPIGAKDGTT